MKRNDWVVLTMRVYAISFLVVGFIFLWAPSGLATLFNELGDKLGMYADAPSGGNMLWLSLTVAYMATVTLLAYFVQKDPAKNTQALVALTVAKATSSLTSFAFYFGSAKAFLYLTNGVVDGSIALSCLLFLVWLR